MKQDIWLAGVVGGGFVVVIFVSVAVGIVAGNTKGYFNASVLPEQKTVVDKNAPAPVLNFVTLKTIGLDYPTKGQLLTSPVQIVGRASKDWFVNDAIGVRLEDDKGNVLVKGSVMTKGIVEDKLLRFEGSLAFTKPAAKSATLILYKLNGKSGAEQTEMKVEYDFK